ncbi:MAG: gamma-glutamylcyclotransferase [Bryobacterales bacterium]|nr:gamma-glutamylcyclotransferase [Bryobacterales bacterium]
MLVRLISVEGSSGHRDGAMDKNDQLSESHDPRPENGFGLLSLFVYGTLKRGYRNHDVFCQGLLELREAQVRGRLYDGPGYPLLQVPDEDILAQGTLRPTDDVATQARFAGQRLPCRRTVAERAAAACWGAVHGELLTFDDAESRLPGIDRLEGFHPGGRCLYRRVLVTVVVNGACEIAWLYAVETTRRLQHRLISGRWPA